VQSSYAYLPGSSVPLRVEGIDSPYKVRFIGEGAIRGSNFLVPLQANPGVTTLVAYNAQGIAQHDLRVARVPNARRSLLAIASYDSGIVLHDATTFAPVGTLAIGGAPSDVAVDASGRVASGDTAGTGITIATLAPWDVATVPDAPVIDELAFDPTSHALFATNRTLADGNGALTRVMPDGTVAHIELGLTSEGIAIDARRRRVYVANVNDGTISIVDADAMRELRRVKVVERAFALALSPDGSSLWVVSNQSVTSPFGEAGSVVRVALDGTPHLAGRSGRLAFPVGVAFDARANRIFVTDEHDDDVYVMNATTLRETHIPLRTCRTPWKPLFDSQSNRLYVPCARADLIDVFDARTLRRVAGAPFATGGYPLAVAAWHP
jgi:DNA-binding beta-propeller fold protein YncE